MLCVWECKDDMEPKEFTAFINGPDSPAQGLINKAYKVMPGAGVPPSAWPAMPTPTAVVQGDQDASEAPTGHYFWISHAFNKGKADEFFAAMATMDLEAFDAANVAKGFKNHAFMPSGPTDKDPVFCIWESKEAMTVAEFQAFIDGPDGPAPGTFVNSVYPVMAGATVPPTAWPKSFLDEAMDKIESMMPFKVDSLVAKFEEATKSIGK